MEHQRLFTIEEANSLLPVVRPLIQTMQAHKAVVDKAREEFSRLEESHARGNGFDLKREALATRIADTLKLLRASIDEIQKIGVMVKDIDMGLVDFPGRRNGEIVNLCWKVDEDRVRFWHSLDTGFGSRQPL